jgi:transposase
MPAAVPLPTRLALCRAAAAGASPAELADRFALPRRTVYHLLQRARDNDGQPPHPAYRTGPAPPRVDGQLLAHALDMRRDNPGWGSGFIHTVLSLQHQGLPLPSPATLRRHLRRAGLSAAPPGRRPERPPRAAAPHQRWQVDAADQMRLGNGEPVSWLRAADECSGAVLGTVVFPPGPVQLRPAGAGPRGVP